MKFKTTLVATAVILACQVGHAQSTQEVAAEMRQMREELRQLWLSTHRSREQLAADLQAWCRQAENSGIAALQEFSLKLRAARA